MTTYTHYTNNIPYSICIGQSDIEIKKIKEMVIATNNILGNIAEIGSYNGGSGRLICDNKNKDKIKL